MLISSFLHIFLLLFITFLHYDPHISVMMFKCFLSEEQTFFKKNILFYLFEGRVTEREGQINRPSLLDWAMWKPEA